MKTLKIFCFVCCLLAVSGCKREEPNLVLNNNYFVGVWEHSYPLFPNSKETLDFSADGTVQRKTPNFLATSPAFFTVQFRWLLNQNTNEVILGERSVYKILNYTNDQFTWQDEGGGTQRFVRLR